MHVRCLVRDPAPRRRCPTAPRSSQGDVLDERTLPAALDGIDVAYYLVHSMGGGGDGDFAERDRARRRRLRRGGTRRRRAARRLPRRPGGRRAPSTCAAARRSPRSWRARVPDTVHVRAAMVIGAGSASFLMLRHLVERLPAMVVPALDRHAHPAGRRSATSSARSRRSPTSTDRAERGPARRRRRPHLPRDDAPLRRASPGAARRWSSRVPVLTPRLSSYWVGLVTPVDTGLARAARRRA